MVQSSTSPIWVSMGYPDQRPDPPSQNPDRCQEWNIRPGCSRHVYYQVSLSSSSAAAGEARLVDLSVEGCRWKVWVGYPSTPTFR